MVYLIIGVVFLLVLVPIVVVAIRRHSDLYLGDEDLEKRLKKHKINLVHNRLDCDGIIMYVSEYWKVYEKEGRKAVFTRLEHYYKAPLLRYFHLVKRPQEEVINRTQAASLEMITTEDPHFDNLFVIRTKTGEETLQIVTESLRNRLLKHAQESEADVEFFDSFMRYSIPGKPSYIGTDVLVGHIRAAAEFAQLMEQGRSKKPLPDEQQAVMEAIAGTLPGGLEMKRCPEGGVDLVWQSPQGYPVYFTLSAGTNGLYLRVPLVEGDRPLFAFSETSFPQEYPTAKYNIQTVSLEGFSSINSRFRVLYVLPKVRRKAPDTKAQASFQSSNQRRVFNVYMKKVLASGVLDTMEEALLELEDACMLWSQDRFPAIEMNGKHIRGFIPGPIPETVDTQSLLSPFIKIKQTFELAEKIPASLAQESME